MKPLFKYILFFITFLYFSSITASEYITPRKPFAADIADIDLDGDLDIVIIHRVNWGSNTPNISVLENVDGQFLIHNDIPSFPGGAPDVKLIDLNGDGYKEIISFTSDSLLESLNRYIRVFQNSGGNFLNFYDIDLQTDVNISDMEIFYDSLGANIAYLSHDRSLMGILRNDGAGNFSSPQYTDLDHPPSGIACGDLDNDGREDIVIGSFSAMKIFYNKTSGLVEYSDTLIGKPEIADINNDNVNEIVLSYWGIPGVPKILTVYERDQSAEYNPIFEKTIYEALSEFSISDLNNDNYPEIIYNVSYTTSNSNEELFKTFILDNNTDNSFGDPTSYYTGVCSHKSYTADLDNNGYLDIVTLNYDFYNPPPDTGSIHILYNDGNGLFIDDTLINKFWEYVGEFGGQIACFEIKDNNEIYAGTLNGVYLSTDNGNSWTYKSSPSNVFALDTDLSGNIFAGTNSGVYQSTDDGNSWIHVDNYHTYISDLIVNTNGYIIAGSFFWGIYISTDGGNSWELKNNGLTTNGINSLAENNTGTLFAGTQSGGIFRSTDFGDNWTSINSGLLDSTVNSIAVKENNSILCGTNEGLYYSVNNGDNWERTSLPENRTTSIITSSNGNIIIGTFKKGVYRSQDDGVTWKQENGGLLYPAIMCLDVNSEGNLLAGAAGGAAYKSINSVTNIDDGDKFFTLANFHLFQNYPNPFNPTTTINYSVAEESFINITVFDVLGRKVAVLVNENKSAGNYVIKFDAEKYNSGIYFYQIDSGKFKEVKKMLLLK